MAAHVLYYDACSGTLPAANVHLFAASQTHARAILLFKLLRVRAVIPKGGLAVNPGDDAPAAAL